MTPTRPPLPKPTRRHPPGHRRTGPAHRTPTHTVPEGDGSADPTGTPRYLSHAQRAVAAAVITGTLTVAGIGFTGSYTAVRQLAINKGFGNFSYLFPIGIDAGICVLLALDLLLTWIRTPFPLLRQTAWVLTAATIAFNGAAAWPNPLGTAMHAVIPILFVVAVEAARHATGRIADITADTHMESVRPARWLLSPLPTFLLWRRMKLWELRSYHQVIKLEQERLVYQARLQARYGRTWRRKAPVESLMPLRLARYGIPLAETTPAGLAAAGISGPLIPVTNERTPVPAQRHRLEHEAARQREEEPLRPSGAEPQPTNQPPPADPSRSPDPDTEDDGAARPHANAPQARPRASGIGPTSAQVTAPLQDQHRNANPASRPPSNKQPEPRLQPLTQRHSSPSETEVETAPDDYGTDDAPSSGGNCSKTWPWPTDEAAHGPNPDAVAPATYTPQQAGITGNTSHPVTASEPQDHAAASHDPDCGTAGSASTPLHENATAADLTEQPQDESQPDRTTRQDTATARIQTTSGQQSPDADTNADDEPPRQGHADGADFTVVDRYYLAWRAYQAQHGREPSPEELSAFLASDGMLGRERKPLSPSTLRRYPLQFRIYNIWAEHRARTTAPSADAIAQECTARGTIAQYNKPITPAHITKHTHDFERRWTTLTRITPKPTTAIRDWSEREA
ncbi:DUF2637 domain-containing protein [Streptomyces sp. NPDC054794]